MYINVYLYISTLYLKNISIHINIMSLNKLTIQQASEKLRNGEITSQDLVRACLDRIAERDGEIHACLTVCEQEAMDAAKKADKRRENGEDNPLLGIPFLAKDNIMTKGVKTTAASKILEDYIAPFDATIIKKLKDKGAVLLGKTNLDEFAHGASTENSRFGPTKNPVNTDKVPGGSSGGSGAAVADDMCLFALGTDTGGSIRHPASFCGVVGLKPTYGRSSRFGLIAMTSSTDVPGPLTKTTEDASLVLSAIAGSDRLDATTADMAVPDYAENMDKGLAGLRIGVPKEYFEEGGDKEVAEVIKSNIERLKEAGAEIVDISLPHTKYGVSVYYIITPSEISSNLARFDGIRYGFSDRQAKELMDIYRQSRGQGFGSEVKRRIMLGTYSLSAGYKDAYYLQAQKVRTKIAEELDRELNGLDALVTPTTPDVAFDMGSKSKDPLKMYLEDVFATPASLAGLPALSVPAGEAKEMPVGMQLIGKKFDESTLFRIGYAYQKKFETLNLKS
jgi:aspartyl-tRNA(Asn)/glutamyl-tRNA(Gln) amidotransferase subunit A